MDCTLWRCPAIAKLYGGPCDSDKISMISQALVVMAIVLWYGHRLPSGRLNEEGGGGLFNYAEILSGLGSIRWKRMNARSQTEYFAMNLIRMWMFDLIYLLEKKIGMLSFKCRKEILLFYIFYKKKNCENSLALGSISDQYNSLEYLIIVVMFFITQIITYFYF